MQSWDPSTLWRLSEFEHYLRTDSTAAGALDSSQLLSSSLLGEIGALEQRDCGSDVVEVLSMCRRLQEPALIYLEFDDLVWPVTIFPAEGIYHSRHDLLSTFGSTSTRAKVIGIEPAAMAPPGLRVREHGVHVDHLRPLQKALWHLAIGNPTRGLLREIGGPAAYRALRSVAREQLVAPGAIGHAVERLHLEAASLKHISQWPGMSVERGVRLLNALYLTSNLIVSRSHPLARAEPAESTSLRFRRNGAA